MSKQSQAKKATGPDNQGYLWRIDQLESENAYLHGEINRLHAEIRYRNGVRNQLASLYKEVDTRVLDFIETKGARPRKHKIVSLSAGMSELKTMTKEQLLLVAREADGRAFFRYKSRPSDLRIFYRVAGGVYITSRNVTKQSVKGAYKLSKGLKR